MSWTLAPVMFSRFAAAPLLFVLSFGCSAKPDVNNGVTSTEPSATEPTAIACPEGFRALEHEHGCTPILPEGTCPNGTRAAIGFTTCAPVGVTECADGFVPHASGWGCDVVLPEKPCSGATIERVGSPECAPVSNCDAVFPPAEATHFVDAEYPEPRLDGKHFRRIEDAIKAAPAGATIAIQSGTYNVERTVIAKAVNLVGRCADKVILTSSNPDNAFASTARGVRFAHMTFRGFAPPLNIQKGKVTIDSVVIDAPFWGGIAIAGRETEASVRNVVVRNAREDRGAGAGLVVSAGAHVDIDVSAFAENVLANVYVTGAGTVVRVRRSVIRDVVRSATSSVAGVGIAASEGATLEIDESAIVDNLAVGVSVSNVASSKPKTKGTIRRSVVRGTKRDSASGQGDGINVMKASLTTEETTVAASSVTNIVASGTIEATNTTLLGSANPDPNDLGPIGFQTNEGAESTFRSVAIVGTRTGGEVTGKAKLTFENSLIQGTRYGSQVYLDDGHYVGIGLLVDSQSELVMNRSSLEGTRTRALLGSGRMTVDESLIRGTRAALDASSGGGIGVHKAGYLTLSRSAVVDNEEAGIFVANGFRVEGAPTVDLRDCAIEQTVKDPQRIGGSGLFLADHAVASMDRCTIRSSRSAAIVASASGAVVRKSFLSANQIAVVAQDGTTLVEGEEIHPLVLSISLDTRLLDNETRVGSGSLPIPRVLLSSKGPP